MSNEPPPLSPPAPPGPVPAGEGLARSRPAAEEPLTDSAIRELLAACRRRDRAGLAAELRGWQGRSERDPETAARRQRWRQRARASAAARAERRAQAPAVSYPPALPITARRAEIVDAIRRHQVVIVAGETGSGKTTQLPKMCLEAGLGLDGQIGCTQPRRVAALSISRRLAEELQVTLGRQVGCKIRFSDQSSPDTYVKLMTDGILLAEIQGDADLNAYDVIIVDEAHERSLNIDFLLGYLKLLLGRRPDLKLVITSATIDTAAFARAFDGAPVIEVSGRLYPVEVRYAPPLVEPAAPAVDDELDLDPPADAEPGPAAPAPRRRRGAAPDELHYVDAAVRETVRVLGETPAGDVLVFMPTERDIRETADQLAGRALGRVEVVPLFGRLSAGDQQRVFAPGRARRVVVATNIAETSLTIPGIRYVVDTGLARLSRYNPRTRTRRLPVEPISQSSANQRKGRCGRVENGVCVRLYSEKDFAERPPYTQPEIQRANLADVILRMKAFGLGEIETFPFLNPPAPAAIQAGYDLLTELGALEPNRERTLTPTGRELSRLPVDPTVGRMLLQSRHEHAVRELLVIAAGLSVPDPRERPLDAQEAADAAHRRFADPASDFLGLLRIWQAAFPADAEPSTNQLRRFCRTHFLSFTRMREWREIHSQLAELTRGIGMSAEAADADYAAVHRAVLAGTLGHVANRVERNVYRGAGNRQLTLFPGSSLFDRGHGSPAPGSRRGGGDADAAATAAGPAPAPAPAPGRQPAWTVAGEIVETNRLYARMVAGVEPAWILELGAHLCKHVYGEPRWSAESGRVLVRERVLLHGLEVLNHWIGYGRVNPRDATDLFIRCALVPDELPGAPDHLFRARNRALRERIENFQTRMRQHDLRDLDEAFFDFYRRVLGEETVASVPDLNRLVRARVAAEPDFLCATEADLVGDQPLRFDEQAFPDAVRVADVALPLQYAYAPGEEHDGVTVRLTVPLAEMISPGQLEWMVPGLRQEQVDALLRALPKAIRRQLLPLEPKVAEIAAGLQPGEGSLTAALARFLRERYRVAVNPSDWPPDALPEYLRPRVVIVGPGGEGGGGGAGQAGSKESPAPLAASRDLAALRTELRRRQVTRSAQAAAAVTPASPAWTRAAQRWEHPDLTAWTVGDLPERVLVTESDGLPVYAYPGLHRETTPAGGTPAAAGVAHVSVRLFPTARDAREATGPGLRQLAETVLAKDLAWLRKDLRGLTKLGPLYVTLGTGEELQQSAYEHLLRFLIVQDPLFPLTAARFTQTLDRARERLPGLVPRFTDQLGAILRARQELLVSPRPYPGMAADLAALLPQRFLEVIPPGQLTHLPRYLRAMAVRAERAALAPAKDEEKARQLRPYLEKLARFRGGPAPAQAMGTARRGAGAPVPKPAPSSPEKAALVEELRWMVEEYRVSLFAQELRTAYPVSTKRLDDLIARIAAADPG